MNMKNLLRKIYGFFHHQHDLLVRHRRFCLMSYQKNKMIDPATDRRPIIWRKCGAHIGKNVQIGYDVYFDATNAALITLEDNVWIAARSTVLCHKRDMSLYCKGTDLNDVPFVKAPVHICKGAHIGMGTIILPGITVGEGAVVGAGSVVTKDIPSWCVVAGNPAKVLRYLAPVCSSFLNKVGSAYEYSRFVRSNPYDGEDYSYSHLWNFLEDVASSDRSDMLPDVPLANRMLNIAGAYNVSDLGGLMADEGNSIIRSGKIVRGSDLDKVSGIGAEKLKKMGIAAELDLRTDDEARYVDYSPLGQDVPYIRLSTSQDYSYGKVLNGPVYIEAVQWIIDNLKCGSSVYFHCTYGADRTGTLAAIIEGLLGVSESEIAMDYELSSFSSKAGARSRAGEQGVFYGLIKALKSLEGETLEEKIYSFLSKGVDGVCIQPSDLDWFRDKMLEKL